MKDICSGYNFHSLSIDLNIADVLQDVFNEAVRITGFKLFLSYVYY